MLLQLSFRRLSVPLGGASDGRLYVFSTCRRAGLHLALPRATCALYRNIKKIHV